MSDATVRPPEKKEVALALLEGSSMFVHFDPRRPDVTVPKWFVGQPQLILQVGLNMAIPIPDLKVTTPALPAHFRSTGRRSGVASRGVQSTHSWGRMAGGACGQKTCPRRFKFKNRSPSKSAAPKRSRPNLATVRSTDGGSIERASEDRRAGEPSAGGAVPDPPDEGRELWTSPREK